MLLYCVNCPTVMGDTRWRISIKPLMFCFFLSVSAFLCASVFVRSHGLCFAAADVETFFNFFFIFIFWVLWLVNSCFHSSTILLLFQCLNRLLFSEGDAEETTVVLTKGAEVKRIPGRGTESLAIYVGWLSNYFWSGWFWASFFFSMEFNSLLTQQWKLFFFTTFIYLSSFLKMFYCQKCLCSFTHSVLMGNF